MQPLSELQGAGLRRTTPRLRILAIFQANRHRHMSAEEVYRILLEENTEIGLSTVYRVLSQLEQAHLLASRQFGPGPALYELNEGDHHDHLVCVECGQVDEFSDEGIEARQQEVAQDKGFVLRDHSLVLYGRCARCQAERASSGSL
ncbi:ferric iron uptake transcriptional regulator [Cupriavidus pauculus]|uniref:Ferric uptake regulation protein n=1 Tax=Cupriavidus pauculus TaxID=82633 RepID=A0A2N5CDU5_9BURK|nr:ferric iron uptake transcriptional regulator [Cupriavidus pauculus]PLQ00357.1 ferric iron uptake transcriptional regulator [Cupriavidus pauculus]